MIPYLGDFVEDDVVYVMFNTFTSDDPSASSTITNFVNTDVHIHKDDGLTQRNNAAGITVSVNFDGITGSHLIKIDTNDNTVAGFWIKGHDYFVRIEGTTVDAATINAVVAHFSIENRYTRGTDSAALATALTTAQNDLDKLTGADGATLATAQGNYAPNKVVPDVAGTAPTVAEIRTEMEGAGTKLTLTLEDTGTTIPGTITALQTDVTAIDVLTEGGGSGDLAAIKTQVDAILDLERESGVVTVTNVETTLYEDAAPTKNKMGVVVKVDMAALASGDTFVVKEKYKDESGGAYQEVDSVSYTGAQTKPLRIITLTPYRYGAIITMQRTAGVNRSIEWESFMGE